MASSQRQTRRTSARLEADADDAPPAKKQKVEKSLSRNVRKPVGGKKAPATAKPNSRIYDSNDDDFHFSRKEKKSLKSRAEPAPAPGERLAPDNEAEKSTSRPRGRPKRSSDSMEEPNPSTSVTEPARRSKRLSGDTAQPTESQASQQSDSTRRGREKERPPDTHVQKGAKTPQQDENGLRVERKRKDTKIALPFADTPVIQRNKDMRQTSAENRRRSSSTMRGRRASSLIDSGTSNAVPHNNVSVSEFYKHISNDLPEPRRMKQLLTWCGSRALTERPNETSKGDINAILAARVIQDELVKDFTNKSEMSDWFSREDEIKPAVLAKKPNPRNVQNASKLQELEAEVQRLEQEKLQWDGLLSSLSSNLEVEVAATKQSQPADVSRLDREQVAFADLLEQQNSSTAVKARKRLKQASTALEFKVDTFAEGVHRLTMLEDVSREWTDGVMANASNALEQKKANDTTAGSKENVGNLLRAFSRTGG